ncbi:hypothetical protein PVK06_007590 [Gossypium arboreum]|uniref:Uncharacterized protein n=1 Tax=Gossypium arboreum TaxID=29729 RepID=A0ABR0QIN8_GOSAR|nr:hypothetical protein PVK06_007590 [Gossypium arboreum]
MDLDHFTNINMDAILKSLIVDLGIWKRDEGTKFPLSKQVIMFPIAKMRMQFLCTRVSPLLNTNIVNIFLVVLHFSILRHKRICLGYWIDQEMKRCIAGGKVGMYFPPLVTDLCRKTKAIQWLARLSDSSEGKDEEEEETNTKGNGEGEATDDEESKGDDATSHAEATEDIVTHTHPMIKDVEPEKQSMPIHRTCSKKTTPKGRNILKFKEIDSEDDTSNA